MEEAKTAARVTEWMIFLKKFLFQYYIHYFNKAISINSGINLFLSFSELLWIVWQSGFDSDTKRDLTPTRAMKYKGCIIWLLSDSIKQYIIVYWKEESEG